MEKVKRIPILTIAGSDSIGGAGIQADLKTMMAHGLYGMSAVTALTAQNTLGVKDIMAVSPEFLKCQLECIFTDIFPAAVKVGMLGSMGAALAVAEMMEKYKPEHIVIDPVIFSTSKHSLIGDCDIGILKEKLFPKAELLTPNILELEELTGRKVDSHADMEAAAVELSRECRCSVLCKGGHFTDTADDLLYMDGSFKWFRGERIDNENSHGTGCTLSSAIASNLALGDSLYTAVEKAKEYVRDIMSAGLELGKGNGPLDHAAFMAVEGTKGKFSLQ